MAVEVKSQRMAVVVGWDPKGAGTDTGGESPEAPDGFPTHPIYLPPYVDNAPPGEQPKPDQGLPGDQPKPDQGLPGDQPKPDQGLPGDQPRPDQGLPGDQPRPDQGLPGEQPGVEHPIYLPPYIDNSLPGEVAQKLKEFLTGNLPPSTQPVRGKGGAIKAVQVFAQGQDGDWSNTAVMPNDGEAPLHYPSGFKGESYVEVRGLDGTLVDSGTITVK
jgi:hypothetical protein